MFNDEPGLKVRSTATEMAIAWQSAQAKLTQAEKLLNEAAETMTENFPRPKYSGGFNHEFRSDKLRTEWIQRAWAIIAEHLELRNLVSSKRWEEFQKQLHDKPQELPDITEEMVIDWVGSIASSVNQFRDEACREVFEFLRPARLRENGGYVTNCAWKIGEKVILSWVIDPGWNEKGPFSLSYSRGEKQVADVERVMRLLDGKGLSGVTYNSEIGDAIKASGTSGTGETTYFKFRACKNRNLHLQFKRMDLVQKLNEIGGNALPYKTGKPA